VTNLNKLVVSLTKHGAHKVAELLDKVQPDEVIQNTWGIFPGIKIDAAQARKVLSASEKGRLPEVWHAAKKAGRPTINAIVLLAIVFSHHTLINAMRAGTKGFGVGRVERDDIDGGKGFTNLKDNFVKLGFATAANKARFDFDIRSIIRDSRVGLLAASLLQLKLADAGWSGKNTAADECLRLGLHRALGMNEAQFRRWTEGDAENLDEIKEVSDPDHADSKTFTFKAGHRKRKSSDVIKKGHGATATARLIHNDLQNKLYDHLTGVHGKQHVGTELTGGPPGTSIDLVVRTAKGHIFYEIKTSRSIRKCIREAVPQLLEYAYWPKDDRASELVIVSMNKPTTDAKEYLAMLRKRFGLPIYHKTVSRKTGELSGRV
jgi:hypothetical protein